MSEIATEGLIYHGPGCCSKCGGPIAVIDSEMTVMELNQDGHPISEETVMRVRASCMHCGDKLDMMRWKDIYIPYNESSKIIRCSQLYDELQERVNKSNLESKEKNPFVIE